MHGHTHTHTHTHTECGYCLEQLTIQITNLTELINTTLIQLPEPTLVINMTILNTLRENISRVQVSVCTSLPLPFFSFLLLSFLSSLSFVLSSSPFLFPSSFCSLSLLQSDVEHLEGTLLVLEVAVGTRDELPDNTTLVSKPSPFLPLLPLLPP